MDIQVYQSAHLPGIVSIWNECVSRGEALYRPLVPSYFNEKFLINGAEIYTALEDGCVIGFIAGCVKTQFLPGQNAQNTPGYLSTLMVAPAHRNRGVASALLARLESRFRAMGKTVCAVTSTCPINLDWIVPGTPGHEHNNMPGADAEGMGYDFLIRRGYAERVREVAMYLDLATYQKSPEIEEKRAALAAQDIRAGLYDPALAADYHGMCDRVGSEYWRQVLREELEKDAPRPILAAVHQGQMVGFTGPVDRQENGRGWFTGICTDPLYEKRGIASVLFNDLMEQFIRTGAAYSTLFTGRENHAQKLYLKTGFRAARQFAIMHKQLEG